MDLPFKVTGNIGRPTTNKLRHSTIFRESRQNRAKHHSDKSAEHILKPNSHHAFLLTLNDRLFLAPLNDPKKALDIGTGNGIWAQYDVPNSS